MVVGAEGSRGEARALLGKSVGVIEMPRVRSGIGCRKVSPGCGAPGANIPG